MDRSNTFLGSSRKVNLPSAGNISRDQGQRFQQPDGSIIHSGTKRNRTEMGEVIKAFLNTMGIMTFLAGILANLDNAMSVVLALVGAVYGVYKILHAREALLMKRLDRKEREIRISNQK